MYVAFESILAETLQKRSMRVLAYCLMPNHWRFALWSEKARSGVKSAAPELQSGHALRPSRLGENDAQEIRLGINDPQAGP